jgi:hypothetical protein
MKFLSKTAKYSLFDNKSIKISGKNSKTHPVLERINNYTYKLIQHVRRMDRSRLPYAVMKYQPVEKRDAGRPLKRLLDCCIETGTGHGAKVDDSMMMMMMMMIM